MILVTVGSSQFPFDRLLRAVDELPGDETLVVQHGPSAVRPSGASCVPFVPLERLVELVQEARLVVTHAGVGSILVALMNGKRPYVVPRKRTFGETVDDHQIESARRFARAGLVFLVEDPDRLGAEILEPSDGASVELTMDGPLARELGAYLDGVIERRRSPRFA